MSRPIVNEPGISAVDCAAVARACRTRAFNCRQESHRTPQIDVASGVRRQTFVRGYFAQRIVWWYHQAPSR